MNHDHSQQGSPSRWYGGEQADRRGEKRFRDAGGHHREIGVLRIGDGLE